MVKKERGRYTKEFRAVALERMKACPNISTLAQELGVSRMQLYRWSKEQEPGELPQEFRPQRWEGTRKDQEKTKLVEQLRQVKQLLAEKTLEVDFLQGALHRIEARRQKSGSTGATTSTSKSST